MNLVYLDYAATTPVAEEVADIMAQHLTLEGNFANPASRSHRFGWQAEEAVESARITVAKLIGASNREIVWTSGATESNNLAIKGILEGFESGHIITSSIEHKAILDTCAYMETSSLKHGGFDVTYLEPNEEGLIIADQVSQALRPDTRLVSLMLVNNELGNVTDIKSISKVLSNHEALLHCDAAQGTGKLAIDVTDMGVDLMSICAHKMYGPKGIGALYVRKAPEVKVHQQIHGGGHERGMRSGTLATHQIVGFAKAADLVMENLDVEIAHNRQLRDRLWLGIEELGVQRNSHETQCSPNHLNVSFTGVDGEILLASLAQLAVSSGSACNSASVAPSYVLKALGVPDELAHAGIRFSVGRYTTEDDIDFAISEIKRVLLALR
ncbi:MAG: aminotransferase class V-fold PLP-dependent enzyme [Oleispira antarctica]|uniref:cysteine desulfurase n=1 Tax=Oleispira antarctica RB-8 TaxID=698738 RepID=R4YLQ9_OLEAN|nr:aminotransferase class V-fold PLP-dependent enzyme [Oleispira antarctica]MBQ0792177.1 aminotransferase class V-fold PLP-dependent enzyme [Oleispira antarctica]CCK75662.1 Cysteine desulfurase [Oleispira antarctica RB-8]